jgi:hypothetical protein
MKFGELIEHTIECIKTFNPVYKTIDSHADEFLANVTINLSYLNRCLVQGPLRESFHQVSVLRLHTLRGILENILQGLFFVALLVDQS